MAERLTSESEGGKGRRHKAKENKMITNISEVRKLAVPLMEELLKLTKDMESDMGAWKADIKAVYDKGAKQLNCPAPLLRKIFREILNNLRDEEEEQEMAEIDRAQWETLAASFAGTPFEGYCKGQLAEPKTKH